MEEPDINSIFDYSSRSKYEVYSLTIDCPERRTNQTNIFPSKSNIGKVKD
jgi:hypothetical protein